MKEHPVLLFYGGCNLFSAAVQFILKRDAGGTFRFAAMQSPAGERLLASNRFRWFGRRQSCLLPSEEDRHRFLD